LSYWKEGSFKVLDVLGIAAASFMTALYGALVPGPVFALVVSESLKGGRIVGPIIVLGHFIIEWIIISAIFLGAGPILSSNEAKIIVGYAGSAILGFMGLKMLKDSLHIKIIDVSSLVSRSEKTDFLLYNLILSGFIASCSNPYFFLWWLTTGLILIMNSFSIAGILGFILFLIGHASADLLWFTLVSYSVHKGKRILNERVLRAILLSSALFLIMFAAYVAFSIWAGI